MVTAAAAAGRVVEFSQATTVTTAASGECCELCIVASRQRFAPVPCVQSQLKRYQTSLALSTYTTVPVVRSRIFSLPLYFWAHWYEFIVR